MDLSYSIVCRRNNTKKECSSPFSISMTCTLAEKDTCKPGPIDE